MSASPSLAAAKSSGSKPGSKAATIRSATACKPSAVETAIIAAVVGEYLTTSAGAIRCHTGRITFRFSATSRATKPSNSR